jgi:hypothetical protein
MIRQDADRDAFQARRDQDAFELQREQVWLRALEEYPGGLTQAQLAAMVGLSPGHVSRRLARARALRISRAEQYQFEMIETSNPIRTHGCERHHEIRLGDLKVCLACGLSGMDHATPFRGVTAPAAPKPEKPTPKFKPKIKAPKAGKPRSSTS